MLSKDDQLPDNIEDEIAPLLQRVTSGNFWNGERARAFAQLSEALAERGDAPDFVEVGEAGIAVDDAMRRQRRVQLVG
jgi:hypothetical protein